MLLISQIYGILLILGPEDENLIFQAFMVKKQEDYLKGMVVKTTGSWYRVKTKKGSFIECKIKGKFRQMGIRSTNPVAVGDIVHFIIPENQNTGLIISIEERKNFIARKSPNLSRYSQIIAANIDQAILMITLKEPETLIEFIDRYLVTARAYRIPVILLFNKIDLYSAIEMEKLETLKTIYAGIGYTCIESSIKGKINIEKIMDLTKNKISLISGNSGVGKSSLINLLISEVKISTAEISSYHKAGKHTTTFAEMYPLKTGGYMIDTPGIKGFGMVHLGKDELYHFFPEIFRFSEKCKYYNCKHINEPGCAVLDAVKQGEISLSRYQSYLNLYLDPDSKYR